MNEDGHSTPSAVRDTESTDTPYPPTEGKPAENPSGVKSLPPKSLKHYTVKQLCKRHVRPWIIFSVLAIITVLIANSLGITSPPNPDECNDSGSSETEQLFRINLVVIKRLSFTEAKSIDLLWDTVIGQGGRFVHGLVLYQLVSRALTLLLERSTLPYIFFLRVKFSTVSIESLLACLRILFSKTPIRTTIIAIGLFFVMAHGLAFATIWSAATGYEADTIPAYDILNSGVFILKDSDQLTTCWSVQDFNRVEPGLGESITGPTLAQAYGSWGNLGDGKEFIRLKMKAKDPGVKTSEEFRNIYAYALAKETFLHRYGQIGFPDIEQSNSTDTWYDENCDKTGSETANGYDFTGPCTSRLSYTSVEGWQYAGVGQKESENLPLSMINGALEDFAYAPYDTTFLLDPEIKAAERVVPYNSTLWWNRTRIALNAPFLNIGADCRWSGGSLGLCLCLEGKVLSKDFRSSRHICLNDTGYKWGFSGFVVLIGLALETAWLLICTVMWLVIITKSELVKMHRPGTGVIRGILDIAEAMNSSLGTDTGAYAEDELEKELKKCPPVGYDIDDRTGSGYECIRLRPMGQGMIVRRKLRVKRRTLYG